MKSEIKHILDNSKKKVWKRQGLQPKLSAVDDLDDHDYLKLTSTIEILVSLYDDLYLNGLSNGQEVTSTYKQSSTIYTATLQSIIIKDEYSRYDCKSLQLILQSTTDKSKTIIAIHGVTPDAIKNNDFSDISIQFVYNDFTIEALRTLINNPSPLISSFSETVAFMEIDVQQA